MTRDRLSLVGWPGKLLIFLLGLGMLALLTTCVACSSLTTARTGPQDSPATSVGANPTLPEPQKPRLIPTVRIAEAAAWPAGATPVPGGGLQVKSFAAGLEHPRWVYVLPNGDVLV